MASITNQSAPIGIFDSGIGGISIARSIEALLPNEQLIYFADSKFAPYGDMSVGDIVSRVNAVAEQLIAQGVKAIVVACNTATVNGIEQLRAQVNIPIIGVEPAIKPAAKLTKNNKVGIMVTKATATNQRFLALVKKHKNNASVFIQPCPGLVQLIEQGMHQSAECDELLHKHLSPLVSQQIDTLVLGCTHYPLVTKQIQKIVGNEIALIETAKPVAEELIRQLETEKLLSTTPRQQAHLVMSSSASHLQQQTIKSFWPSELSFQ